jgi:hypothetical protein
MEIAELAKRQNHISRARKWYKEVSKLQPCAAQGWLERAKVRIPRNLCVVRVDC